jgi:hypothetical protein
MTWDESAGQFMEALKRNISRWLSDRPLVAR